VFVVVVLAVVVACYTSRGRVVVFVVVVVVVAVVVACCTGKYVGRGVCGSSQFAEHPRLADSSADNSTGHDKIISNKTPIDMGESKIKDVNNSDWPLGSANNSN